MDTTPVKSSFLLWAPLRYLARGLGSLGARSLLAEDPEATQSAVRSQSAGRYAATTTAFYTRCAALGLAVDTRYFWYHTVNLGHGLVTPGMFDYRPHVKTYDLPADMTGLHVLDVGSATGYFAFEFELRGAAVTSVELPSLTVLDRFPGQSMEQVVQKLMRLLPPGSGADGDPSAQSLDAASLYTWLMEGPFRFCQQVRGSRVERCYSSIYELPKAQLPTTLYDLVFIGDVLLHTMDPLRALAAAASVCGDTLLIAQHLPAVLDPQPAMLYLGGAQFDEDQSQWWWPNRSWFEQVLRKLGFRTVEVVAHFESQFLPTGDCSHKTVVRAKR